MQRVAASIWNVFVWVAEEHVHGNALSSHLCFTIRNGDVLMLLLMNDERAAVQPTDKPTTKRVVSEEPLYTVQVALGQASALE